MTRDAGPRPEFGRTVYCPRCAGKGQLHRIDKASKACPGAECPHTCPRCEGRGWIRVEAGIHG